KPFTRAQLFREIAAILPRRESDAEPAPPPAEAHASGAAVPAQTTRPDPVRPEWKPLLQTLQQMERDRWPALIKTMGTRETAAFAHDLLHHGETAACPSVLAYAQKLTEQVERFQITAMETTLRNFPQIVRGVA